MIVFKGVLVAVCIVCRSYFKAYLFFFSDKMYLLSGMFNGGERSCVLSVAD